MTDQTTRRDVLKSIGTASAVSGFAITATASQSERVRVVEAGIRYDVPSNENYDLVLPDSRPPFTVDKEKRRLLVLNTASPSTSSRIRETTDLLDERSADSGDGATVGPPDGTVTALPTGLSARMRVRRAVSLVSPIQIPTVTLNTNANTATLNVESEGTVDLPAGERIEVRLDPVTVEARTTHVVGQASLEGVPEYLEGLKREQDSVKIEATTIVEAVNHGELVVEQQSPPRSSEKFL